MTDPLDALDDKLSRYMIAIANMAILGATKPGDLVELADRQRATLEARTAFRVALKAYVEDAVRLAK